MTADELKKGSRGDQLDGQPPGRPEHPLRFALGAAEGDVQGECSYLELPSSTTNEPVNP